MQFFHQRYAAEVASRVNYNESIAGVLSGPAATAVLNLFVAIFYLLLLLQYNVTLTIIGVVFSAVARHINYCSVTFDPYDTALTILI